jgi:hypothetical protein
MRPGPLQGPATVFFVTNEKDIIQRQHLNGCFYETEELNIISAAFEGKRHLGSTFRRQT